VEDGVHAGNREKGECPCPQPLDKTSEYALYASQFLGAGENLLSVLVEEYDRDEEGRVTVLNPETQ